MNSTIEFAHGVTHYIFDGTVHELSRAIDNRKTVYITDDNLFQTHTSFFEHKKVIVLDAGEQNKTLAIIEHIIQQLIIYEVDRKSLIVGVGGGVVTDITGFVATVYMRGVSFGFVPTSLLAMVDAAIGGKNGVNTGLYKNMIGTIRQPEFIVYNHHFLDTLPQSEWSNGFAEVIKYACIFDVALFEALEQNDLSFYQNNKPALNVLIQQCAAWKNKIIVEDEFEKNTRKLLNFGHTAGHAMENKYHLAHGKAVAIGILIACRISETVLGLEKSNQLRLRNLLTKYELPICIDFDTKEVMQILKMDKKRSERTLDYILLKRIGEAQIHQVGFDIIEKHLDVTII